MIPKFRAWDKHEQKMFANNELIIWNGNVYANDSKKLTCNNLKGWSIDDECLMQSTGLKDRNGKEIFEGDIVSIDTDEFDLLFVKYEVGIYCLMDDEGCAEYLSDYYIYVSVVGNIYENKEYLKKRGN